MDGDHTLMINGHVSRYTGAHSWDDETADNTEMFFEADRLDALAYSMIENSNDDSESWTRFTEAKKIADAQRTAAVQDWMRIKRLMKK